MLKATGCTMYRKLFKNTSNSVAGSKNVLNEIEAWVIIQGNNYYMNTLK
jgi:hypothetical protein